MMLTGIDGLNMFSNRIMTDMNRGKEVTVSANTATVIFGWINFISAFFSLFIIQYFGRVTILFYAHLFMGTVQLCLGICVIYEQNLASVILISVFMFTFAVTDGPIMWIYSAEVLQDSAFGYAVQGMFLMNLIITGVTEYILAEVGAQGLFFIFASFTYLGAAFAKIYLKETRGLTDAEKK